jgi:hypothetical protein
MDGFWEPYYTGYNCTDLKELAFWIWSLWDWDWAWDDESFYWKTQEEQVNKIYGLLEAWERDLLYFVEESDEPFEAEWDYGWDDCWHNYSKEDILKYASTRDDLWDYEEENLIEYVWSFSTHNWLTNRHLSEILDEFSMIDYKDELFDDLNNILFNKFSEIVDYIQKWIAKNKWLDWNKWDCSELASQFVDWKELYDIDYED